MFFEPPDYCEENFKDHPDCEFVKDVLGGEVNSGICEEEAESSGSETEQDQVSDTSDPDRTEEAESCSNDKNPFFLLANESD